MDELHPQAGLPNEEARVLPTLFVQEQREGLGVELISVGYHQPPHLISLGFVVFNSPNICFKAILSTECPEKNKDEILDKYPIRVDPPPPQQNCVQLTHDFDSFPGYLRAQKLKVNFTNNFQL